MINKVLILVYCFLLFAISPVYSQSSNEDSLRTIAIPLSEIAVQSAKTVESFNTALVKQVQNDKISTIRPQVDTLQKQVNELQEITNQLIESDLPYEYFITIIQRWSRLNERLENPKNQLLTYSTNIEQIVQAFSKEKERWITTNSVHNTQDFSSDIHKRVRDIIHYIDSCKSIISDSLQAALLIQNIATDLQSQAQQNEQQLLAFQQAELGSLIFEKHAVLWKVQSDSTNELINNWAVIQLGMEDMKKYFALNWGKLLFIPITFLLLFLLIWRLKKQYLAQKFTGNENIEKASIILLLPAASALLFSIFLSLMWIQERPLFLSELLAIAAILPFSFLLHRLIAKQLKWSIYFFFFLFLYSSFNNYYQFNEIASRLVELFESVLMCGFMLWFIGKKNELNPNSNSKTSFWYGILKMSSPVYLALSLTAMVSNILGFPFFARVINSGILTSLLLSLILSLTFIGVKVVLFGLFETNTAQRSLLVKNRRTNMLAWISRNFRAFLFLYWLVKTLDNFMVWEPTFRGLKAIWDFGHSFGEFELTVGLILNFLLILYITWQLSVMLRLLLQIEIFERFQLPRGVPVAVSSITQYFVIVIGVMLALSKAGFSLQNLSLLAGALGVGIGFGLQNIVNNFISGLILVFERPVTVGDVVNVASHEGTVIKIGIRSSSIRQWDGSQVIVPNADLISNKVINWTLLKYTRRYILPVKTHLSTDADLVLNIMKQAAEECQFVLKEPETKAYFKGVSDNHLLFELYYWLSENILDSKSEVSLNVQKSLKNAGIEFQMPVPLLITDHNKLTDNHIPNSNRES